MLQKFEGFIFCAYILLLLGIFPLYWLVIELIFLSPPWLFMAWTFFCLLPVVAVHGYICYRLFNWHDSNTPEGAYQRYLQSLERMSRKTMDGI